MPYDELTGMMFSDQRASDQGVFAEFYLNPVQHNRESELAGRPVYHDVLHIRIRTPGDRRTEIDRPAKDEDKHRFPIQYARYQQGNQTASVGTPLEQWPAMTPALIKTFKAANVFSVDELAGIPDGNLINFGPGVREWRDRARVYLEDAQKGEIGRALIQENGTLKNEIEVLKRDRDSLRAAVDRLQTQMTERGQ